MAPIRGISMNILAFHFGHDSAVTFIRNGEIVGCQLSERVKKKKLFIGLNSELIREFMQAHDIGPDDVDAIALTSTQREDLYIEMDGLLTVEYRRHPDDSVPSLIEAHLQQEGKDPVDFFLGNSPKEKELRLRRMLVPHALDPRYRERAASFVFLPWMDFAKVDHVTPYVPLREIAEVIGDPAVSLERAQYGFHFPASAVFMGKSLPCYVVNHHAAHAATAYYCSGHTSAAVITADGGAGGNRGGWFFHGQDHVLTPITPNHLEIGGFYSQTSRSLIKLGSSPDGKMMGLAPYGKPTLFKPELVGNAADFDTLQARGILPPATEKRYAWHEYLLAQLEAKGYDMAKLGDPNAVLEGPNIDLAATLQTLFEETMFATAEVARDIVARRGLQADALCLAGGCMLNCPSNTRIHDSGLFGDLFVPPFTDDSGCAIGAGLWAYHNLYGQPLIARSRVLPVTPYLGNPVSDDACRQALEAAEGIVFERPRNLGEAAADDLSRNRILAFFDGASEVGPRALGHRTLMADPRDAGNWPRVNNVKTRALWRPFAPAILKEMLRDYFDGGPDNSPYMLFNFTAKNGALPAVTHVDGTSRVQTVTAENGRFHEVISAFFAKTQCPVVMNTSLNGPGEPIIETPEAAIAFLRGATDDVVLYLNDWRVTRA
ncbi:carbamoyltransferase C-terminal domain-containing protein [Burkholderia gladioli]|uniref:carbamoyltransferase C-terminal domain-containing protein n=2 Tax=Burkholderia gladioli TaxID=28095 RepID=UPI0016407432|nr:carbamoyltransferase C-terminal domain-containing protein [Burkholderia gladioli]